MLEITHFRLDKVSEKRFDSSFKKMYKNKTEYLRYLFKEDNKLEKKLREKVFRLNLSTYPHFINNQLLTHKARLYCKRIDRFLTDNKIPENYLDKRLEEENTPISSIQT